MGSIVRASADSPVDQARAPRRNLPAAGLSRWLANPRFFPWAILVAAASIVTASWMAGLMTVITQDDVPATAQKLAIARGQDDFTGSHYVAPTQLAESNAATRRDCLGLAAEANDGSRVNWSELSRGRPVVLVFIKSGCPCNVEVESYLGRVERLYRDAVRFAGVIDGDVAVAREYVGKQQVEHPVLADPDLQLIHQFDARNGCYVALFTSEGELDGLWPGCSADAMSALGRRIALLARVEERPLDVAGMPAALITGCPFAKAE